MDIWLLIISHIFLNLLGISVIVVVVYPIFSVYLSFFFPDQIVLFLFLFLFCFGAMYFDLTELVRVLDSDIYLAWNSMRRIKRISFHSTVCNSTCISMWLLSGFLFIFLIDVSGFWEVPTVHFLKLWRGWSICLLLLLVVKFSSAHSCTICLICYWSKLHRSSRASSAQFLYFYYLLMRWCNIIFKYC